MNRASCHSPSGAIFVLPWKTFIHHLPTLTAPNKPTTPIHLHPLSLPLSRFHSPPFLPPSLSVSLSHPPSLSLTNIGELKKNIVLRSSFQEDFHLAPVKIHQLVVFDHFLVVVVVVVFLCWLLILPHLQVIPKLPSRGKVRPCRFIKLTFLHMTK